MALTSRIGVSTYTPAHGRKNPISAQPWAVSLCLSYAVGVQVSSSTTAIPVPGHGP